MCAGSFSKFEFGRHVCAHGKRFSKHFRPGHPPFTPRPDGRVAQSLREVKCAYVATIYSTHACLSFANVKLNCIGLQFVHGLFSEIS